MPQILVIDDDTTIRGFLRLVLEQEGYDVVVAVDGAEGLQQYQAEPTALVITDLSMPRMDGLELLRVLQYAVPTPAVIAVSGDQDALTQARRLTPHTFTKPLPLEHMMAAVHTLVAARPQSL